MSNTSNDSSDDYLSQSIDEHYAVFMRAPNGTYRPLASFTASRLTLLSDACRFADRDQSLSPECLAFLANEPNPGEEINVELEQDREGIHLVLTKDIQRGEEVRFRHLPVLQYGMNH